MSFHGGNLTRQSCHTFGNGSKVTAPSRLTFSYTSTRVIVTLVVFSPCFYTTIGSPKAVQSHPVPFTSFAILLETSTFLDQYLRRRRPIRRSNTLNSRHKLLPLDNLTKDSVFPVEMRSGNSGDEELRSVSTRPLIPCAKAEKVRKRLKSMRQMHIRIRARVGHRKQERLLMLEIEILILELLAVNRFAAGTLQRKRAMVSNLAQTTHPNALSSSYISTGKRIHSTQPREVHIHHPW